ncbi:hypothetical protein B046DRAFT_06434 [Streptomyces sp. LamerLS-316]|uniref:hypothetical protein n=1 Tax=unclassified Streptomyces TaxID=2593676 RepID=UPI000823F3B1|nr:MULTISPECIES: hypothetical protein [unclassified Streptomyces]SCK21486.1 hypothetical protein B046DRAFT_06434 [Streptomyces sp. LamerLS-316]
MMEDLYTLRSGSGTAPATEVARVEFQDTYAQAQMLVPDDVLHPCQAVRVALAEARKLMDSLAADGGRDQRKWQEAHTFLIRMWDAQGTDRYGGEAADRAGRGRHLTNVISSRAQGRSQEGWMTGVTRRGWGALPHT